MSTLLIIGLTLGLFAALGWLVWYLVAAPDSQIICPTLVAGPRDRQAIALTFDDGPGEETPRILDILREHQINATFFLCGQNVERYPEIARRIAEERHAIGNHAYSHRRFLWRSPGWIKQEIERAQRAIVQHTHATSPVLFRPPYGLRWFGLAPILRSLGMQAIMWEVNSLDWKSSPAEIASRVARETRPGSIILLHDGVPPKVSGTRANTADALPAIIAELTPRFRFVTIAELQRRSNDPD